MLDANSNGSVIPIPEEDTITFIQPYYVQSCIDIIEQIRLEPTFAHLFNENDQNYMKHFVQLSGIYIYAL